MTATHSRHAIRSTGRPRGKSGLPPSIPGEPFSLIGTLRRTRNTLTVADVAEMLQCSKKAVYAQIHKGRIPVLDLAGLDLTRIDPKGWADLLEHDNRHLIPSARKQLARAA